MTAVMAAVAGQADASGSNATQYSKSRPVGPALLRATKRQTQLPQHSPRSACPMPIGSRGGLTDFSFTTSSPN